ncbi:MAG: TIGR03084 family protein [Acidimicrobiia bacterium]|nr:TIGR03084 family protein [Acidimicrobiia bacterium]
MDATYAAELDDLEAEMSALDALVANLDHAGWATPTPAEGWDVRDSIAHLAYAEDLATTAATNADAFARRFEELMAALVEDPGGLDSMLVGEGRSRTGQEVLTWWRKARGNTIDALRGHEPRTRLPWIAGPMSARSFVTARTMETWAHGQDVADGLGIERPLTARLRYVADIGVRTRHHSYRGRGLEIPETDVRVELEAPDGSTWAWGESTTDTVRGPALDFCLVVTQRRNPADTALEVMGPLAEEWIGIAQAFAGPVTNQRAPRS